MPAQIQLLAGFFDAVARNCAGCRGRQQSQGSKQFAPRSNGVLLSRVQHLPLAQIETAAAKQRTFLIILPSLGRAQDARIKLPDGAENR